jgi:hypothetical protein
MEKWCKTATSHLKPRTFLVDRIIPGTYDLIKFNIEAVSGDEARRAAAELAYAVAWHRGVYPDKEHKIKPDTWAMHQTTTKGQRPEVVS